MTATLTPLPGDASALRTYGARYEGVAERILDVAKAIDAIVDGENARGASVDQLKVNAKETAAAIRKAQPRYHETALALVEFSVDLADAQVKAEAAIADSVEGNNELSNLNYRRRRSEEERLDAVMANESEEAIERIQRDIRHIDTEIGQVEYAIAQTSMRYQHAVDDREQAIREAISRIKPALDQLNDGVLDYVRNAFESLVEFTEAIADWIGNVFTAIVDALLKIILALIVAVVVVILVIVLAAVLLAVLNLAQLLIAAAVILALAVIIPAIAALVIRSLVRELATPTPEMTLRDDTVPELYLGNGDRGNYENIFQNNGDIDSLGAADSTNVEIVTVRDANDAIIGYRVILPSTQDWEEANGIFEGAWDPTGDKGAVNDLGSNVALLTMPLGLRGPYERAVIDALQAQMAADCAPSNTPVMMAGFSQGGILAGRMAADPFSPFNITAVVTGGACIDTFPIPPNVSVLALQHTDDPVPMLDGNIVGRNNLYSSTHNSNSNHVTVSAIKQAGEDAHGAVSYSKTASQLLDTPGALGPQVDQIVESQSAFFTDNEQVSIYRGNE